ncbi:MAG TPA: hypothetical protein GXX35_11565 [Thermoanaerobacterales bacterium]|nr:hypothetical protein [Thermoanaerobacterales bacterium]
MKILLVSGEEFPAEKIIKTQDSIIGKNGDTEVFAFKGINDFSRFQLLGGSEFDLDPELEKEQRIADLEAAITALLGGAV